MRVSSGAMMRCPLFIISEERTLTLSNLLFNVSPSKEMMVCMLNVLSLKNTLTTLILKYACSVILCTSFLWGISAYMVLSDAVICTPLVLFIFKCCRRILAVTDQMYYARISMTRYLLKTKRVKVAIVRRWSHE